MYKRTPPYLTYTGDAIDQGAMRLGVIDQCICLQMGAPLFLLALLLTRTSEVEDVPDLTYHNLLHI